MTNGIQDALKKINPYQMNQAETIAWSEGINSKENDVVGNFIVATRNNSFIKVQAVDFGEHGASRFTGRVGTTHNGDVSLEIRLDARDGKLLGSIEVPLTGGDDRWELVTTEMEKVTGVHDVFFVFKGKAPGQILHFDYWRFSK
ncbi:carbohydrate-binding protein [Antarcticibacterium sp. 1MA-6-2]|uniref:carbohydrate-binding protein n=1 Tax=Antarcticibacterium sp. 1MA-6-2 TaxID=2908210 RepID=UPI001F36D4B2|nr:carbohydrate-binding protein [Antarcticibacterium sp. 1MA-6-2]UJH90797.1 carbohydrate-binding protein [Antarcticibacterium sp. 1MA-6-2]